ncbi:MAG: acyl transferase [Cyclobacteriaceae bacterium]|nr:acyl transferase [Cyclobacteriaceae bacterium HetDA_MAG_MS6]
MADHLKESIFSVTEESFDALALRVFQFQYNLNKVYQAYCNALNRPPKHVTQVKDIPFLPIEFFKTQMVVTGEWTAEKVFLSSGTTQTTRSQHVIREAAFYKKVARQIFENQYGPLDKLIILAVLPSYQTQPQSSLIEMVDDLIGHADKRSGYYTEHDPRLIEILENLPQQKILLGVSFALLNLAETHQITSINTIVMETGGMKGRRREITRAELHRKLKDSFAVDSIHSEYGMTELLSQAYAAREGFFKFPKWAKVFTRDLNDPFNYVQKGRTGGINIIDLANVDSCSFLETKDIGKMASEGYFEVLGRFDNSDVRGCNLMIQ